MSEPYDFANLHAVPDEPLPGMLQDDLVGEVPPESDENYDRPDPSFAKPERRKRNAAAYEQKVHSLLGVASTYLIQNDATQPDAAAIYMYGGNVAKAAGDLAAENDMAARAIDYLTEGSENAVLAMVMATMPLALQIIRNHEPELQPKPREISVPFTKKRMKFKIPFKVGVTLGKLHGMTHDPDEFTNQVLGDPALSAQLQKRGISFRRRGRERD